MIMHADEVPTSADLVERLVAAQLPQWAGLPAVRVPSSGTDNAIYRLGDDVAARLPRRESSVDQIELERRWLPSLAPLVPTAIPETLAVGEPGEGYPFPWSVCRWLPGESLPQDGYDGTGVAEDLGAFVSAMQRVELPDAPAPGETTYRGLPLATRDEDTRRAIGELEDEIDTAAATAAWEAMLRIPDWDGAPVWFHGDLLPGNLLREGGRLSAVIDFGCLGMGDPAADLIAGWSVLTGPARDAFRRSVAVDDDTWARGRGWAFSMALIQLPYYRDTNPGMSANARYVIREILARDPG
jgi:aminoglycoside phosphotransferase (APT) family kinase protein